MKSWNSWSSWQLIREGRVLNRPQNGPGTLTGGGAALSRFTQIPLGPLFHPGRHSGFTTTLKAHTSAAPGTPGPNGASFTNNLLSTIAHVQDVWLHSSTSQKLVSVVS